ncbi:MAG: ROK family protein [Candidatus Eremiobacteraeota bacterium]|nr:ROK family protein [Candidatus Eremiobacteraeota bacterium]
MRIGVDLGGTKIEIIALDDAGATIVRRRVATPAGQYEATLEQIVDLVRGVESQTGKTGTIGIGTPGARSRRTALIKNSNSTILIGHDFENDISRRLGRAVRIANDANCFALSEAVDGAAADSNLVFGVILGTGVGGAIVHRKFGIEGRNRLAGEWGHMPLPWPRDDERPGPACYCGKFGCIETFLSGPSLTREYRALTGNDASPTAIAQMASQSDSDAQQCMNDYEDRLARGLAVVIDIVDPEVIVFGGGVSNIDRLYEDVPPRLERYVLAGEVDTKLRRALHGDSSGVRGAAMLWP